jgi:Xaa-Pro aminopeptidase
MPTKLIIADSSQDANMFYTTGILIPDDFIYLEKDKKKIIYISDLEFNRAKREAKVDQVINFSRDKKINKNSRGGILISILRQNKVKKVVVPENFKMKYAEILLKNKIKIQVKPKPFFEKRMIKERNEIEKIKETQKATESAMKRAIEIIKKSKVGKDKKLIYQNKILTSEFVKNIIDIELLKKNCRTESSHIVSCGEDSADPHHQGKGPLLANQPIVIDIFPKSFENQYFADMTRTVVKGKALPEIKKIYQTVLKAQKMAISKIKPGIKANSIHKLVENYFESKGFKTEEKNGKVQGFFHDIGHGVGLNLQEPPFFGMKSRDILKIGNVFAIEPGLYYQKIGGVRLEDLILVTKSGCENLTKLYKILEI